MSMNDPDRRPARLFTLLVKLGLLECPYVTAGHTCKKDSPNYPFCPGCGRTA
jgi:hypothetical protein